MLTEAGTNDVTQYRDEWTGHQGISQPSQYLVCEVRICIEQEAKLEAVRCTVDYQRFRLQSHATR